MEVAGGEVAVVERDGVEVAGAEVAVVERDGVEVAGAEVAVVERDGVEVAGAEVAVVERDGVVVAVPAGRRELAAWCPEACVRTSARGVLTPQAAAASITAAIPSAAPAQLVRGRRGAAGRTGPEVGCASGRMPALCQIRPRRVPRPGPLRDAASVTRAR